VFGLDVWWPLHLGIVTTQQNQWDDFRRHFEPVATRKPQSSPAQPHDVIRDKA
jgi:hypothetical protein